METTRFLLLSEFPKRLQIGVCQIEFLRETVRCTVCGDKSDFSNPEPGTGLDSFKEFWYLLDGFCAHLNGECRPVVVAIDTGASHLAAPTVKKLHKFAALIGLEREKFRNPSKRPHYELNQEFHEKALAAGALSVPIHGLDKNCIIDFFNKWYGI